mmetsp:Transcript_27374/g.74202  ORF Transcript_27374/g.74202 Transcript_27374/m.74202 type:complete len:316 (-) Transcript_27374:1911-2858(-)
MIAPSTDEPTGCSSPSRALAAPNWLSGFNRFAESRMCPPTIGGKPAACEATSAGKSSNGTSFLKPAALAPTPPTWERSSFDDCRLAPAPPTKSARVSASILASSRSMIFSSRVASSVSACRFSSRMVESWRRDCTSCSLVLRSSSDSATSRLAISPLERSLSAAEVSSLLRAVYDSASTSISLSRSSLFASSVSAAASSASHFWLSAERSSSCLGSCWITVVAVPMARSSAQSLPLPSPLALSCLAANSAASPTSSRPVRSESAFRRALICSRRSSSTELSALPFESSASCSWRLVISFRRARATADSYLRTKAR